MRGFKLRSWEVGHQVVSSFLDKPRLVQKTTHIAINSRAKLLNPLQLFTCASKHYQTFSTYTGVNEHITGVNERALSHWHKWIALSVRAHQQAWQKPSLLGFSPRDGGHCMLFHWCHEWIGLHMGEVGSHQKEAGLHWRSVLVLATTREDGLRHHTGLESLEWEVCCCATIACS